MALDQGDASAPLDVVELAVNLDDLNPEVLGAAQQALLDAGALDVWTTSIGMKKQRPGVMLSLLCKPPQRDAMANLMLELTGSFGVRFRPWGRMVLDRRFAVVTTRFGDLRIKIGSVNGQVRAVHPEFEDAAALARRHRVPLREVMSAADAAAQQWRDEQRGGQ